jgi:hypothetical protein
MIKKAISWLRWIFLDSRLFWFLVLAVVFAAIVLWFGSELAFRTYGFGLQIIGVFFAVHEVFSNERLFGQPRIKDRVEGWWRSRPGATHYLSASGVCSAAASGSARVTQRTPKADTDTVEEQVAKLWKNIDHISQEITGLTSQVDQNKGTLEAAIKAEREARENSHKVLRELVKEATVGSPLLAYFGVILVLMGSTITTYSQNLHSLVK